MTDITELAKRLRARTKRLGNMMIYPVNPDGDEAADALEAQAKEIKTCQQTELTYITRVADVQREYSEMQAKLEARIAELKAALKPFADMQPVSSHLGLNIHSVSPGAIERARAARNGKK